ncbi:MAG: hypothetical protein ACD_71C00215G0006 [uncultured bacterium (gcode 4)]|uniref:Uncharacterized protein n=1 Tax=uncultured bacterium (gcode 4) TaxID=1234023 RepID=K2A2J9_9BACT|nr:MAG: hypothetical protein ACD_71C00215G0006 [uncultured bacterium (gcode 4)]
MNFNKLSKYFSWKLPNSEKLDISEFVKVLWNLDIEWDFISTYWSKFWSIKTDYNALFKEILASKNWENKIYQILEYFELSRSFLEVIDYEKEMEFYDRKLNDVSGLKKLFLSQYIDLIESLEDSNNNKFNWTEYENFIEKFLLHSSYFNTGFKKEFKFEIWWQKIDKLLKLNRHILNLNNPELGYTVVEIKFKKKNDLSVNEVPQFESYIRILAKNKISRYWIFACSNDYKTTAIEKFKVILENENSNNQSFYISLITWIEIREFLENRGNYENMTFDEFIERSFIKWLK